MARPVGWRPFAEYCALGGPTGTREEPAPLPRDAVASIAAHQGGGALMARAFVRASLEEMAGHLGAVKAAFGRLAASASGENPGRPTRGDVRKLEDALAQAAKAMETHKRRCDELGRAMNMPPPPTRTGDDDDVGDGTDATALRRMFEAEVRTATAVAAPADVSVVLAMCFAVRALDDFRKKRRDDDDDDDDMDDDEEEEEEEDDDDEDGGGTHNHPLPGSPLEDYFAAHKSGAFSFAAAVRFRAACFHLRVLGLGGPLEVSLGVAVRQRIEAWLADRADGAFDEGCLRPLWRFAGGVLVDWLRLAHHPPHATAPTRAITSRDHLWRQRLRHLAVNMLCTARADALFDMIVDYPDSLPGLRDLAICLQVHPERLAGVASSLRASMERRLLHPGASTSDLLTQYASMAKSLGHVDPSGTVLAVAGAPVAAYLRGRADAVRGIVEMVSENEEADDDANVGAIGGADDEHRTWVETVFGAGAWHSLETSASPEGTVAAGASETVHPRAPLPPGRLEPWTAWNPGPPRLASLGSSAAPPPTGAAAGSLTATLVGIYGREALANEYRTMVANRLLARAGYVIDRELRSVELLKMRLGEAPLRQVEVMLRDMADSRRIHASIRAMRSTPATPGPNATPGRTGGTPRSASRTPLAAVTPGTPGRPVAAAASAGDAASQQACGQDALEASAHVFASLSATIISHLFWPPVAKSDDALIDALPMGAREALDAYARRYASLKSPRKIRWMPHLGTVTLRIQGATGGTVEVSCTPAQASVIASFTPDAPTWSIGDLARKTHCSVDACRKRAAFWVSRGLLLESAGGVYEAASAADGTDDMGAGDAPSAMDDEGGAVASKEEQEADSMAVYESFIIGMLTNFDSLSLERIQNMLKMFVVDPAYDKTQAELSKFLQKLVTEEKVAYEGGSYRKK